MRLAHRLAPLALSPLLLANGCGRDPGISLVVVTAPGQNPFVAGGATQAVVTLDDGVTPAHSVAVGADGSFALDVDPSSPQTPTRLRLEARAADGSLVGVGCTPPIVWGELSGHTVAVLVQPTDTLIPAPAPLAVPRAEFRLVSVGGAAFGAFTLPDGQTTEAVGEVYSMITHTRTAFGNAMPVNFDGHSDLVGTDSGWYVERGDSRAVYTGTYPTSAPDTTTSPPATRPALTDATTVDDYDNGHYGGWFVGGRGADGALSTRVDHVMGSLAWDSSQPSLQVGRTRPDVLVLAQPTDSTSGSDWLVVGGQNVGDSLLERYNPTTTSGTILSAADVEGETVDHRTGVTAVCVQYETQGFCGAIGGGCKTVLVLGGALPDGTLAQQDLLLDGDCALHSTPGCALVRAHGTWFSHRRAGAHAALADGGRVLIVGGHDAQGQPVFEAESIDVTNVATAAPAPGRVVATLPNSDPAIMSLTDGRVAVAGGRTRGEMAPATDLWFYRF